jgi:NAD/NADP transhydrogenase beta subunit
MGTNLLTTAYLGAAILFIQSLGGLSSQTSARRGNLYGLAGMVLAIGATALNPSASLSLCSASAAARSMRAKAASMRRMISVCSSSSGRRIGYFNK